MAWNAATYNKYKTERFAPFYDGLALIEHKPGMRMVDLGCGTGELTRKLSDAFSDAEVLGIDSSEEMLDETKTFEKERLTFQQRSIQEQLALEDKWDLVFSNAAIQWIDDHASLLPQIIHSLRPGGQLVIQIPNQHHNAANILLAELVSEEPFLSLLHHYRRESPVLEMDQYAQLLFSQGGKKITVFEKIYPLIVQNADAVFDFIAGTALLPYLERLQDAEKEHFTETYKNRLRQHFKAEPVFYPFKRIIMSAHF